LRPHNNEIAWLDQFRKGDIPTRYRYSICEGNIVDIVKVSTKFQITIPTKIRQELQIKPGVTLRVSIVDGAIRLSPYRSLKNLRGIAKGMTWKNDYRDRSERF